MTLSFLSSLLGREGLSLSHHYGYQKDLIFSPLGIPIFFHRHGPDRFFLFFFFFPPFFFFDGCLFLSCSFFPRIDKPSFGCGVVFEEFFWVGLVEREPLFFFSPLFGGEKSLVGDLLPFFVS